MVGSLRAADVARRAGIGPALILSQALTGVARLLIPFAMGPRGLVIGCLMLSELLLGAMRSIFNITQISLRQAITPAEVQGRVNASIGFLLWALTPLGALAGGLLGDRIGIRPTLWIAASGVLASTLLALASDLRETKSV